MTWLVGEHKVVKQNITITWMKHEMTRKIDLKKKKLQDFTNT